MFGYVRCDLTELPTSSLDRWLVKLFCLPPKFGCPLSFVSHTFYISIHISGIMLGLLSGANYEHKESRSTSYIWSCAASTPSAFRCRSVWDIKLSVLILQLFRRFPSTLCSKNPADSKILCCTTARFLTWVHIIARDTEPQWQAVRVSAEPGVTAWAIKSHLFTATSTHLKGPRIF